MAGITRRKLGYSAAGLAATILSIDSIQSIFDGGSRDKSTIDRVKEGTMTPQEYVDRRINNLQIVLNAKERGELREILVNPSQSTLEETLIDAYSNIGFDSRKYILPIADELLSYGLATTYGTGTILPSSQEFIGKRIPFKIALSPSLFESAGNDHDVESAVKHHLSYASDFYYDLIFGSITLRQLIDSSSVNPSLVGSLIELRAAFLELKDVGNDIIRNGSPSLSPGYLDAVAKGYARKWFYLASGVSDRNSGSPKNQVERKLSDYQLAEFGAIRPDYGRKGIKFEFAERMPFMLEFT